MDENHPALSSTPEAETRPGLRHFGREVDGRSVRYHLRVDPDGGGILLANASEGVSLSETGTLIAEGLLDGAAEATVVARLRHAYGGLTRARALEDVRRVAAVIESLARPSAAYPMRSVAVPGASIQSRRLRAPLSADLVLPSARQGKALLDHLWNAGVPQVTFVVEPGAPTDRLVELVEAAEDLGLITGVRARASDLGEEMLRALVEAGIDHVDLHWAGPDAAMHDAHFGAGDHARVEAAFALCHDLEVCPVAVMPLIDASLELLEGVGPALASLGVQVVVAFALVDLSGEGEALAPRQIPQLATTLEEQAERHGLTLIWAAPLERFPHAPISEQLARGPRAAGEGAVRVLADGVVLPPADEAHPIGNLLTDRWERIFAHPSFSHLRERVDAAPRCDACPGLDLCATGCPRDPASWARTPEGGGR